MRNSWRNRRLCRRSTAAKMGKKAVLVGCNYPGMKAELKGCINDVRRMHCCLIQRFGFAEEDITVLIDTDSSYKQPTGVNIHRAVSRLVGSAEPGDFLFFHYSGHGIRLPAESDGDDDTGYDECIVPCDMNIITGEGRETETTNSFCFSQFSDFRIPKFLASDLETTSMAVKQSVGDLKAEDLKGSVLLPAPGVNRD